MVPRLDAPRSGEPAVGLSFVVIAFNEEQNILACLDAILTLRELAAEEILVVDDGSTDDTPSLVDTYCRSHPTVRRITQANAGRGAARAAGVAATTGRLLAMVDADICLPEHWLIECLAAIEDHDVVGGTAVPDGDVAYLYRRFGLEALPAPSTTTITGNNGLYRREVFATVTFNPALRNGEDIDLNHQLAAKGWRSACIPGLLVVHREDKSFLASLHWLFESGVGASGQLARYRELRAPDVAFAGMCCTLAAAAVVARSGRCRVALALPPAYLGASATRHMVAKFALRHTPGYVARFAAATGADMALLGAYYAGRAAGLGRWYRAARGVTST